MDKKQKQNTDIYQKKTKRIILRIIVFIVGVILQIIGQGLNGYRGLGIQFVSLILLLLVLWDYNRSYK